LLVDVTVWLDCWANRIVNFLQVLDILWTWETGPNLNYKLVGPTVYINIIIVYIVVQ